MQRTSCEYNESERPLTSSWLESISWEQAVNKWCRKEESNLRPTDYESVALPTELFRHYESKSSALLSTHKREGNYPILYILSILFFVDTNNNPHTTRKLP